MINKEKMLELFKNDNCLSAEIENNLLLIVFNDEYLIFDENLKDLEMLILTRKYRSHYGIIQKSIINYLCDNSDCFYIPDESAWRKLIKFSFIEILKYEKLKFNEPTHELIAEDEAVNYHIIYEAAIEYSKSIFDGYLNNSKKGLIEKPLKSKEMYLFHEKIDKNFK